MIRQRLFPADRGRFVGPFSLTALLGMAAVSMAAVCSADAGRHGGPEFPISVAEAKNRAEARFQEIDADRSGEIGPDELAAAPAHERFPHHALRRHFKHHRGERPEATAEQRAGWRAVREEHREAMNEDLFERLDSNGDGLLSQTEFSTRKLREARRQAMQERLFSRLDEDGSGGISREELPDPSRWLEALDADGDGMVTREEARAGREARVRPETRRDGDGQG